MAVPTAPTGLAATHGDESATITFTLAVQSPAVTDIEYSLDSGAWTSAGVTESPVVITGLTNGTQYGVRLRAVNSEGNGAASGSVNVTPSTVPGAPGSVTVTGGDNTLTVAYTNAGDTGGNAISSYQYNVNGTGWVLAPATPFSIAVANDKPYTVVMRAVNINGGGATASSAEVTPTDSNLGNNDGFTDASIYANAGGGIPNKDYADPDD